eukprot:TRINITY_DN67139_c4_g8_i1.p1 TRINITY_DN67139_c4_g8~~TRINITY_DN67139_c4_g8_i1.p1  ORF type:complete len:219 (+),score=4.31 TRINITY_DN67139_c4_g8_i1:20-676(+)
MFQCALRLLAGPKRPPLIKFRKRSKSKGTLTAPDALYKLIKIWKKQREVLKRQRGARMNLFEICNLLPNNGVGWYFVRSTWPEARQGYVGRRNFRITKCQISQWGRSGAARGRQTLHGIVADFDQKIKRGATRGWWCCPPEVYDKLKSKICSKVPRKVLVRKYKGYSTLNNYHLPRGFKGRDLTERDTTLFPPDEDKAKHKSGATENTSDLTEEDTRL